MCWCKGAPARSIRQKWLPGNLGHFRILLLPWERVVFPAAHCSCPGMRSSTDFCMSSVADVVEWGWVKLPLGSSPRGTCLRLTTQCKHMSICSIFSPKISLSESQVLFHRSVSSVVNRSKGHREVILFWIEIRMFLLWRGINHELTGGVGNGRRIRTGSCKIRADKTRKKLMVEQLDHHSSRWIQPPVYISHVQTSSVALHESGTFMSVWAPQFRRRQQYCWDTECQRWRGTGRAGIAAKPSKTR